MKRPMLLFLAIVAIAGGGCANTAPPAAVWTAPPVGLKAADVDTTEIAAPPRLTVVQWAAFYDYQVVFDGDMSTWLAAYPGTGTPVRWFVWQQETMTAGGDVPPETAAAVKMVTQIKTFAPTALRDSFRIRVAGVDSLGRHGPWSEWAAYPDTLKPGSPMARAVVE